MAYKKPKKKPTKKKPKKKKRGRPVGRPKKIKPLKVERLDDQVGHILGRNTLLEFRNTISKLPKNLMDHKNIIDILNLLIERPLILNKMAYGTLTEKNKEYILHTLTEKLV